MNLNSKYIKKIAFLGGSFNPIHNGHIYALDYVHDNLDIDAIVLLPNNISPFKLLNTEALDKWHRHAMAVLATMNKPYIYLSNIELDGYGVNYTIDTILAYHSILNDKELYFIIGDDILPKLHEWKDIHKVLSIVTFIVLRREMSKSKGIYRLVNEYRNRFIFGNNEYKDLSSSNVRQLIREGKSIKRLVPEQVDIYIQKYNLYTQTYFTINLHERIKDRLKQMLSEKRYEHSLSVANEAVKLAKVYAADTSKAYIAGLLHDMAKELKENDKLKYCKIYNIELDKVYRTYTYLTHGPIAACMAKEYFFIEDPLILSAIAYHTTGRPHMSLIEKIIYVADFIEPLRTYNQDLEEARGIAYSDLDKAVLKKLEYTITSKDKNSIHPLSIMTYNSLKYMSGEDYWNETHYNKQDN